MFKGQTTKCMSLVLGAFRHFGNRSVSFQNKGLQLDRSVLVPFFTGSVLVPFRPVLSQREKRLLDVDFMKNKVPHDRKGSFLVCAMYIFCKERVPDFKRSFKLISVRSISFRSSPYHSNIFKNASLRSVLFFRTMGSFLIVLFVLVKE